MHLKNNYYVCIKITNTKELQLLTDTVQYLDNGKINFQMFLLIERSSCEKRIF